jgi:hypothetical protein
VQEAYITSQVSDKNPAPGDTISDSAVISGLSSTVAGKKAVWQIRTALIRVPQAPDNTCPAEGDEAWGTSWLDPTVGAEVEAVHDLTLTEEQVEAREAKLGGSVPTSIQKQWAGGQCLTYAVRARAVAMDGTVLGEWIHAPGDPNQTAQILMPTIVSHVSSADPGRGPKLTDEVEISGIVPTIQGQNVTWSLEGTLAGPETMIDDACTAVDWEGAGTLATLSHELDLEEVKQGTVLLPAIGDYLTSDYLGELDACASYGWQIVATLDDGTVLAPEEWSQAPGHPDETAKLTGAVEIMTGAPILGMSPSTAAGFGVLILLVAASQFILGWQWKKEHEE